VVGDRPTYLSIDIDCLDPCFAPGTGTPVVDGLAPHEILSILRQTTDVNFVGMDLVEVAPPYDPTGVTALLGASLILEYICARAAGRQGV
jgi:agmatinase